MFVLRCLLVLLPHFFSVNAFSQEMEFAASAHRIDSMTRSLKTYHIRFVTKDTTLFLRKGDCPELAMVCGLANKKFRRRDPDFSLLVFIDTIFMEKPFYRVDHFRQTPSYGNAWEEDQYTIHCRYALSISLVLMMGRELKQAVDITTRMHFTEEFPGGSYKTMPASAAPQPNGPVRYGYFPDNVTPRPPDMTVMMEELTRNFGRQTSVLIRNFNEAMRKLLK